MHFLLQYLFSIPIFFNFFFKIFNWFKRRAIMWKMTIITKAASINRTGIWILQISEKHTDVNGVPLKLIKLGRREIFNLPKEFAGRFFVRNMKIFTFITKPTSTKSIEITTDFSLRIRHAWLSFLLLAFDPKIQIQRMLGDLLAF